ncbi:hypothetical protein [Larkinella rosea]|uniref:Uncharacterized protein n=1 Tax=Larkinella rosea TaxID=2025312 RepID=A0A3P1BMT5_9BACT|nr:hypothetical protein [Larkinella rosea]RRB02381.1 hypothetical protein EHT25_18090 [Larkinella rosea]
MVDSTRKLNFRFNSLGFAKNNEFFGPIADGYTLFGYQLNPRLAYQPAPNVVLEAGIYLKSDFGQERITQLAPTFTVKFRHKNWNYLFGTLEGSVSHKLIEPLYNFERLLRQRIENGLQINHQTTRTFFDFWISYLQNTLPGYTRQEHFWGGFSLERSLLHKPGFQLSIPVQLTVFHAGGQNIVSPLPVRTALNAAASLSAKWQRRTSGFLRSARLDTYVVGYSENAEKNYAGGGFYPNLTVQFKPLTVLISYWRGTNYRAEYGGDLYQSYTRRFNSVYQEKNRQLVIVRLLKDISVSEGVSVTARFEPHYDLNNGKFEHSEGVYINFRR